MTRVGVDLFPVQPGDTGRRCLGEDPFVSLPLHDCSVYALVRRLSFDFCPPERYVTHRLAAVVDNGVNGFAVGVLNVFPLESSLFSPVAECGIQHAQQVLDFLRQQIVCSLADKSQLQCLLIKDEDTRYCSDFMRNALPWTDS